jgi:hypothetical protein
VVQILIKPDAELSLARSHRQAGTATLHVKSPMKKKNISANFSRLLNCCIYSNSEKN